MNKRVRGKYLRSKALEVQEYLHQFSIMLSELIGDKEVCLKDRKWLKGTVLASINVMTMLDVFLAIDKVLGKRRKR